MNKKLNKTKKNNLKREKSKKLLLVLLSQQMVHKNVINLSNLLCRHKLLLFYSLNDFQCHIRIC